MISQKLSELESSSRHPLRDTTPRLPRKRAAILIAACASIFAAIVSCWSMASGVGISADSLVYLGAADSIASGKGVITVSSHYTPLTPAGAPLTIFPPAYPALVAAFIRLGLPAATSAKWFHVIMMAATVFMIGIFTCLATEGSVTATLGSILLFGTSTDIWNIYTMAWSESPFIFFCLAAFVFLLMHVAKPNYFLLIGASLAEGLAMMTRYVGIVIIPPMILTILLLRGGRLGDRLKDSLLLIASSGCMPAAWLIRNILLANTATDRSFAFHPPGKSDVSMLIDSLLVFWAPWSAPFRLRVILFALAGGLVIVFAGLAIKKSKPNWQTAAPLLTMAFAAVYVLFLLTYDTFVSPAAELDVRELAPFYVFVNVLAVIAVYQVAKSVSSKLLWRSFFTMLLVFAGANASRALPYIIQRHQNGSGYASRQWADSATIDFLRRSAGQRTIYSNGVDVIAFLTGKEAVRLPAKIDPVSWQINRDFDRQMAMLNNDVMQNRAVIVIFDRITWRYYLPRPEELGETYKLPLMLRLDDGAVYGLP